MIDIKRRPYKLNWSGNPIVYTLYSVEAESNSDLLFEIRLMFQPIGGIWKLITTCFLSPVNGLASIDVSELLQANLQYDLPELNGDLVQVGKNQTGFFYIEYREFNAATNDSGAFIITENQFPRLAAKGGIHPYQLRGNNFWDIYFPQKQPWFTWQSSGRLAALNERLFLSFLNVTGIPFGNLKAFIHVTFTDGTQKEKPIHFTEPSDNCIVFVRCGATDNDLQTLEPDKNIWYWEVSISDVTVLQTKIRSFRFTADNRKDYNEVNLLYRNSLGGLDSIRVRGEIEPNVTLDGLDAVTAAPADWMFSSFFPRFDNSTPHRELINYKGEIGYIGKQEQDRLRDFLLSREHYQVVLGRLWPAKLNTKQYKLGSSKDKRFSLPVEWSIADDGSNYYTPLLNFGQSDPINNVCDARIENINIVKTAGPDNTSILTWSWDIISEDNVEFIEYKIDGYSDWVRLPNPTNPALKTSHPKAYKITFRIRPVCHAGSYGPETAVGFIGIDFGSPLDPGPESMIYNNTSFGSPYKLESTKSGEGKKLVDQGVMNAIEPTPFYTGGLSGPCIINLTLDNLIPVKGEIYTNGTDDHYLGTITGNTITWNATIINGFFLIIS